MREKPNQICSDAKCNFLTEILKWLTLIGCFLKQRRLRDAENLSNRFFWSTNTAWYLYSFWALFVIYEAQLGIFILIIKTNFTQVIFEDCLKIQNWTHNY